MNIDRRHVIKRAGLVGAAGVAVTAAQLPYAGQASADTRPLGTWAVDITTSDPTHGSERGLFAFTADGLLIETNTGSLYTGIGSWRPTSDGFRFGFREQAFDAAGNFIFEVHVTADATFTSASTFTGTGAGKAYAPDGTLVGTTQSHVEGRRYGIDA